MTHKPIIPDGALAQHIAVLGKTGSGKSSAMRGLTEGLLDRGEPVCIIDPKGDWWGIKLARDGKRPGYPVVIFGGEHADVPINAHSGAAVAELFATGNRPCLIDLGGWMVGERTRFWIDFSSTLFKTTRGLRWLVIDEVHNFAPKGKIMDPDSGKALHWTNRLASEGRGKGLQMIFASQRPQKVHNDTLTSAETLIAMRVLHPADRGAVSDWVKGCGDLELGAKVLNSLAQMNRGEGWVWSPEIGFGPERVKFPMFKTYDSFRPQTAEDAKHLKGWAEVDLEDIKTRFAAVVHEVEANDPKLLRRRIAELEREQAKPRELVVDVDALEQARLAGYAAALQAVQPIADRLETLATGLLETAQGLTADLGKLATLKKSSQTAQMAVPERPAPGATTHPPKRHSAFKTAKSSPAPDGTGTQVGNSGLRRILVALAQRPAGLTARQIGVRAGMSSKSGTFSTYVSRARGEGWIDGDRSCIQITDRGIAALGDYDPLPTGRDLLEYWLRELGESGQGRLLRSIAEAYPKAITKAQAAAGAGLADNSGTFSTYISRLRSLELISGRGEFTASAELFD